MTPIRSAETLVVQALRVSSRELQLIAALVAESLECLTDAWERARTPPPSCEMDPRLASAVIALHGMFTELRGLSGMWDALADGAVKETR